MNDNENKTNAPTIKLPDLLPCPLCEATRENGREVEHQCWYPTAALNEADALRAEVEGLRTAIISAIRETCDIRQAIRDGKTDSLVVIENSFYVIQDNLAMALAAIKPNAAAGEQKP